MERTLMRNMTPGTRFIGADDKEYIVTRQSDVPNNCRTVCCLADGWLVWMGGSTPLRRDGPGKPWRVARR